MIRTTQEGG